MKYIICLVLLVLLSWQSGKYLFETFFLEDIREFEKKLKQEHPEYFKAPEAKRLGKSLQNSL